MSETNFLLEALKEFEQKVVQAAKDNLTKQNTSGELSKSIKGDVKQMPNSIRVFFEMNEYGFYQDRGVKGTKSGKSLDNFAYTNKMPPPKAFDKWTVRKGIAPRDVKGKFQSRKGLNFAIAKSIFEKGIKPTMFFTKPFEKAYSQLPEELIDKYGLDMENLLLSIIDENFKQYYG
tara:strand:- start:1714 stop:2238 length:525 start_codon:yes stop_codon:yes gene_type:complete